MKRLIVAAAALVAVVGYALTAWAACPAGTTYQCSGGSCSCR